MNVFTWISIPAVVATIAVAAPPSVPTTPASVRDIVYVQPFQLDQGYEYAWREEKPTLTEGYLVVLKVHPEFVYPRQSAEPVLFAGDETVERINVGYPSGMVVAVIPGRADLARTPIWFGEPGLPEQVNAAKIREAKAAADAANIRPLGKEKVDAASAGRAEPVRFADREALRAEAGRLIKQFSPEEAQLADSMINPGR